MGHSYLLSFKVALCLLKVTEKAVDCGSVDSTHRLSPAASVFALISPLRCGLSSQPQ